MRGRRNGRNRVYDAQRTREAILNAAELCSLLQRPARSCLTACTSLVARGYACFVDHPTTIDSTLYDCTYTTCTLTSVPEYPILGAVRGIGLHHLSPWDLVGECLSGWAA